MTQTAEEDDLARRITDIAAEVFNHVIGGAPAATSQFGIPYVQYINGAYSNEGEMISSPMLMDAEDVVAHHRREFERLKAAGNDTIVWRIKPEARRWTQIDRNACEPRSFGGHDRIAEQWPLGGWCTYLRFHALAPTEPDQTLTAGALE